MFSTHFAAPRNHHGASAWTILALSALALAFGSACQHDPARGDTAATVSATPAPTAAPHSAPASAAEPAATAEPAKMAGSQAAAQASTPASTDDDGEKSGAQAEGSRNPKVRPPQAATQAQWSQTELEDVSAEVRGQVEDLRGLKFKQPVAVKLTDKEGFTGYLVQHEADEGELETMHRDESVAKLLGLLPADMDYEKKMTDLLREQVGGFYDPSTKTFYLMDTCTGGLARIILAHELTHALDDQYFDLDAHQKECGHDSDCEFAFRAVAEGSATQLMTQWAVHHASELSRSDMEEAGKMGAAELADAPPFLWKPLIAAYLRGQAFLDAARKSLSKDERSERDAGVRRAFTRMPRSSEQVLHPPKYWDETKRDEPMSVAIDTSHLPQGWKVAGEDTLGELTLALLTTPLKERKGLDVGDTFGMLAIKYTNKAAEGWGGDRLVLLARGDDRVLDLVTAWDTQKDADEFAAALGADPGVIPVLGPGDASGFLPGATATAFTLEHPKSAAGEPAVVVVRIASFSKPESAASFDLPWHVTPSTGDAARPK